MLVTGAAAPSPRQEWLSEIADQNKAYAQTPHAMLKIQDSVYLGEGQAAALTGRAGQGASWKWKLGTSAEGPLKVAIHGGRLVATLNGKPVDPAQVEKTVPIDKDIDVVGHPTQVGAGVPGWRLFVYNQQNPAARSFKTVTYYPYDPAFRVTARFSPDPKLPPRVFRTSRGTDKQFFHAGDAVFTVAGVPTRLPFYTDSRDPAKIDGLSAFFTDRLTGKGAYGAGRYVDVEGFGKFPPAAITIDFNLAYNPNCARSSHFTCPIAVDDVATAIKAGEQDPHFAHR